jgi:hypothetical protein
LFALPVLLLLLFLLVGVKFPGNPVPPVYFYSYLALPGYLRVFTEKTPPLLFIIVIVVFALAGNLFIIFVVSASDDEYIAGCVPSLGKTTISI